MLVAKVGVVIVAAERGFGFPVAIRQDELAAVNLHVEIEVRRINTGGSFGYQQVGQDQPRALVFVAEIEQFGDGSKQIELTGGPNDDARKIPLPCAEHLPE